jgi:hypothetical protein
VILNRVHPRIETPAPPLEAGTAAEARALMHWLGERDHAGVSRLRALLPGHALLAVPLLPRAPTDLASLAELGQRLALEQIARVR